MNTLNAWIVVFLVLSRRCNRLANTNKILARWPDSVLGKLYSSTLLQCKTSQNAVNPLTPRVKPWVIQSFLFYLLIPRTEP